LQQVLWPEREQKSQLNDELVSLYIQLNDKLIRNNRIKIAGDASHIWYKHVSYITSF